MSNETKRDVFEDVLARYHDEEVYHTGGLASRMDDYPKLRSRYDAALPDDLPVIPKDVSEWLTWCKEHGHSLKDALDGETRVSEDTFSRAWLLDVWKVAETGEVVKL